MQWLTGTLLNGLFGTTFDVMDETKRQQTTKGGSNPAYVHIYSTSPAIARHMDVSRSGHERNGNGCRGYGRPRARRRPGTYDFNPFVIRPNLSVQDFERKSALFSLASSEVLLINLWEHQVGLYQGANMGLLKTVFEVNLGLFGKRAKDGHVFHSLRFHNRN
jgi:protein SEY1